MAKQKTVLITGAAIRLGRAIALSFADDGWDVAIHYNRSHKAAEELAGLICAKKRKAYIVQADLQNEKAVAAIIPALARRKVALDCLINNAALFEKDTLKDFSPASLQQHMQVNLFAPLLLTRTFAAQYEGTQGNVINITDGITGWSMSSAFLSYSLSKLALTQATQLLTRELAPRIRINAIAPGPTLEGKQDKKDTFAKLKKIIPLARTSSPEEVCDAIRYLLSAPSVSGQVIALSGGIGAANF